MVIFHSYVNVYQRVFPSHFSEWFRSDQTMSNVVVGDHL